MEGKTLSKNVMTMKFMKRKEDAEIRAKALEEEQKQLQDAKWVAKEATGAIDIDEKNFLFARKTGRRSFGKFNPYIERLHEQKPDEVDRNMLSEKEYNAKIKEVGTIPDVEMAEALGPKGGIYGKNRATQNQKRGNTSTKETQDKKRKM